MPSSLVAQVVYTSFWVGGGGGGGREVQSLFKKLEAFHSDEVSVAENSPS